MAMMVVLAGIIGDDVRGHGDDDDGDDCDGC